MDTKKLLVKLALSMTSGIIASIFSVGLYLSALIYSPQVTVWSGSSKLWYILVGGDSNIPDTSLHLSLWVSITCILFLFSFIMFIFCIYDLYNSKEVTKCVS